MTDVVLFDHAQGLTPGVQRFADDLGRPGHRVTVPDLFEGKTFATLDAGMAYVEEVGFGTILERGRLAALVRNDSGFGVRRVLPGRAAGPPAGPDVTRGQRGAACPCLHTDFSVRWPVAAKRQVWSRSTPWKPTPISLTRGTWRRRAP